MSNSKMETGILDIFSNLDTVTAKGLDTAPAEEQFSSAHYRDDLPQELIAQAPLPDRASARCLIVDTTAEADQNGVGVSLEDKHFTDICNYFHAGDVLVLNNTKVIPARAFAFKKGTEPNEENTVEILFVQYQGESTWKAMISKPQEAGTILVLNGADIAEVLEKVHGTDDIIVVIESEPSCMTARGVKKPGTKTRTATLRGLFNTDSSLRQKFYNLIGKD